MTNSTVGFILPVATTLAGLLAAILGVFTYFNHRTRRDRIAALGVALNETVAALGSAHAIQRAAAAIRTRRFSDRRSELGAVGTAYAGDAPDVLAAALRETPPGTSRSRSLTV